MWLRTRRGSTLRGRRLLRREPAQRKLSGWNIFQKAKMSAQNLTPEQYKIRVGEVSKEWKGMSFADREPYMVQAKYENELRDKLACTPLASKETAIGATSVPSEDAHQGRKQLEDAVGRKGCQKLSARRLKLNVQAEKDHVLWTSPTQFGDSALSVLGGR